MWINIQIEYGEVVRLVVEDLIAKRNNSSNKVRESFDDVLKYYLTKEEFQLYVIESNPILVAKNGN